MTTTTIQKTCLWDEQIFTLDHALTEQECQHLIGAAESKGFKPSAPSGGGHGRTGREDPRTSQFCILEDHQGNDDNKMTAGWSQRLWDRVRPFLPPNVSHLSSSGYISPSQHDITRPVMVHPRLRVYKYEPGQAFPEHIDYKQRRIVWRPNRDTNPNNTDKPMQMQPFEQMSYMTLLVYLNDDFAGGETGFWTQHDVIGRKEHCRFLRDIEVKPHQVVVQPKQGRILICDQNLLHEGLPPSSGVKYVLRTDIIYERAIPLRHPKLLVEETAAGRRNRHKKKKKNQSGENLEGEWERLFETSCKNYAD